MQTASPLTHACAGSAAGALAYSLLFPLDTLRVRMQREVARVGRREVLTWRLMFVILEDEGVGGLYRGLDSSVFALLFANFVYFFAYRALALAMGTGKALRGRRAILVPALAGVVNVLASCPVYVLSTKLRTSVRGSWFECASGILREDGVSGFWRGLVPSLALVANPTINYFVYGWLKRRALAPTPAGAGSLHHFLAGSASAG